MIKTAVILAAGLGSRFGAKTKLIPKGFVKVKGIPMIVRSIEILVSCGIERIIIGTGYKKEFFEELKILFPQIECCFSEYYETTNSMWTLLNCKNIIKDDDFLLLESDIVFEKKAITVLLESDKKNILLGSSLAKFQDMYYIECDKNNHLTNCSTDIDSLNVCGELVGIHKISSLFYNLLCQYYSKLKVNAPKMGYEFAMLEVAKKTCPLDVIVLDNLKWYEIDDILDLEYVEKSDIL
jgi:choline kinase